MCVPKQQLPGGPTKETWTLRNVPMSSRVVSKRPDWTEQHQNSAKSRGTKFCFNGERSINHCHTLFFPSHEHSVPCLYRILLAAQVSLLLRSRCTSQPVPVSKGPDAPVQLPGRPQQPRSPPAPPLRQQRPPS